MELLDLGSKGDLGSNLSIRVVHGMIKGSYHGLRLGDESLTPKGRVGVSLHLGNPKSAALKCPLDGGRPRLRTRSLHFI